MNIINTPQGSQDWLQIRKLHRTASEAPAALGESRFTTRNDLLKQKQSDLTEEVNSATQALYDRGHAAEAAARSFANTIVGEDLYPITGTLTVGGIDLLASLDGATMDESIIWEHKLFSEKLAADVRAGTLAPHYTIQLDQQLLVSGANKCLFMTSDGTEENMAWCWYESSQAKFDALVAGWQQFNIDLANYVPPVATVEAIGRTPETLPALHIEVTGMVTASNMAEFKTTAIAAIKSVNRDLKTDKDFADNAKAIKWCTDIETRVKAAKEHALGQTASIDALFRTMDEISAEARATRLELEKLDKARKEQVRGDIMAVAVKGFAEHISALNARFGKAYMPIVQADFGGVIKGKKTVESLQNAVDTEMARAKIDANTIADKIQTNLTTLIKLASDYKHLFSDTAQIVLKAPDDLTALVKSRISDFKASEEKRIEAEREKIRAEEVAKIEAARAAKEAADKLEAEQIAAQAVAVAAATELQAAKQSDGVELSPAAQALNEEEGANRFATVHPARKLIASIPVQTTTTRAEIIAILDTLSERDLTRTLHFMQFTFAKQAA